jgi:predicted esterase
MNMWRGWIVGLLLVMSLGLAAAVTGDDMARLRELYAAGDYGAAMEFSRGLLAREPENTELMVILAGLHSLEKQPDAALEWLGQAVRAGFANYPQLDRDSDFDTVRSLRKYRELHHAARRNAVREMQAKTVALKAGEWTDLKLAGEADLPRVKVQLSYDYRQLEIKAEVRDSHFKDGHRAWRYGDGFTINFTAPENFRDAYSDRFHAFGFCLEKGQPLAVLVNHDNTYYLRPVDELRPRIETDPAAGVARYHIAIPWEHLYPFHPLLEKKFGMNIIYHSQNDDGTRRILQYIHDDHYDSERVKIRRYAPVILTPSLESPLAAAGIIPNRLVTSGEVPWRLAVWNPEEGKVVVRLKVLGEGGGVLAEEASTRELPVGRTWLEGKLSLTGGDGRLTLQAALNGRIVWADRFLRYDPDVLAKVEQTLAKSDEVKRDPIRTSSRDTLRYRLERLRDDIGRFTERDDLEGVHTQLTDLRVLQAEYEANGSVYTRPGYLLAAFTSPRDGSVQPFSLVIPEDFDPREPVDLVMALHGSGVDETGFVRSAARMFAGRQLLFVAPRGRGLSDWWMGASEQDAVDLVRLVKEMFSIRRTVVSGFSMGGYGVWRLAFRHPELFDAAICVSGTPVPPGDDTPENDMRRYVGQGKDLAYLVIHGTADRAVGIDRTDAFMDTLRAAGYRLTYHRVPGGGHGDFSVGEMLASWLAEWPDKPQD